jgi:hypothetical protein
MDLAAANLYVRVTSAQLLYMSTQFQMSDGADNNRLIVKEQQDLSTILQEKGAQSSTVTGFLNSLERNANASGAYFRHLLASSVDLNSDSTYSKLDEAEREYPRDKARAFSLVVDAGYTGKLHDLFEFIDSVIKTEIDLSEKVAAVAAEIAAK